jgi:hypothetical protein
MKNMTIAASLIMMIAVLSCPTQAALVHHWKMDGNATDSVGTWNGTGGSGFATGIVGQAATFGGTAASDITFTFNTTGLKNISVAFWMKLDPAWLPTKTGLGRIMGSNDAFEIILGGTSTGGDGRVANNLFIAGGTYPGATTVCAPSTWYHVVCTSSLSTAGGTGRAEVWINGVLEVFHLNRATTDWVSGNFAFGQRVGAGGYRFPGLLDDIRVYDTILTAAEIGVIYNSALSGTTNPSPANNALGVTSPIHFSWDSVYAGAGHVSQYSLYMDTDEAKVSQATPPAGLLISGAAVTPAPTTPFTGTYTYNGALINDQKYFWRADTLVLEPNNVDPNNIVYNIPLKVKGGVYSFTGPLSIPLLTGPADVVIEPNQFTHVFGNTNAVFTADINCSVPIVNVQWFKEGNATPLANGGQYTITWGQTQTTLTITSATTANNGKYYCKAFTANASAESRHALLYRQVILKHRYSFNDDLVDSVGGANGTLINNGGTWASVTSSELVLANTGQVSGDANSINTAGGYVQLPGNLIGPMGNYGTFVVWFTSTDPNNAGAQKLFAFGDPGVQPFNANNMQFVGLQSNTQMAFLTDAFGVGNGTTTNSGTTVATANAQFCLVGRFNGVADAQTVFIDGVQKGSSTGVSAFDFYGLTDTTNYIGRSMTPTQPLFKGKINELRIYDIALTDAWIKAIYDAGPDNLNANPCNSPKGYDYTGDCRVTLADFAVFAQNWLYCGRLTCQ